jgi:hypothetical protein
MHVFFGAMAARFIGWADSPFQAEVGFASLGFAAVGFLAFRGDRGTRTAAVVGPSLFLLGAAGGHIYQMITAHNFAPAMPASSSGPISWFRRSGSVFSIFNRNREGAALLSRRLERKLRCDSTGPDRH